MTINSYKLQRFCVEKNYFNCGDNSQYKKLFYLNDIEASPDHLALAIWLCSDNVELREVTKEIRKIAYK